MLKRYRYAFLLAAISSLLFAGHMTFAHRNSPAIHPDIIKCEDLVRDRNYTGAIESIPPLLSRDISGKDYAIYLLAVSYFNSKNYEKTIETCNRLQSEFPNSEWALKSGFKEAEALAAKKDLASAENLYSEMLGRITDTQRRKKLAMEYVVSARELMYPDKSEKTPSTEDYLTAKELLSKAVEFECLTDEEEQVKFEIIVCCAKTLVQQIPNANQAPLPQNTSPNELRNAVRQFKEKFPASNKTDEILYYEAQYYIVTNNLWEARDTALQMDAKFPKSAFTPQALFETAFAIKNNLKQQPNFAQNSIELFRLAVSKYGQSDYAPKAQSELAGYLYELQRQDEAVAEYVRYAELFPKDEKSPEMLLTAATISGSLFNTDKTIDLCNRIIKTYPDSPAWQAARQKVTQIAFSKANVRFLKKDYEEALKLFNVFTSEFPSATETPNAEYMKGEALRELGKYAEAVEQWKKTAAKFPGSAEASKSIFTAAELCAEKLDDYENAMKLYEKAAAANPGSQASQKIAQLKSRELAAETEKIFTTDETPQAKITVRNIEKLKFMAYQIDINDYFDKKLSFEGLNSLEMSIISPDKEWDYTVKDFKKYKQFKLPVELPYRTPGAYIIVCKSENLQAETVVAVSDTAFIAKLSKTAVRLYGENMKKLEAVALENYKLAADGRIFRSPQTLPDDIKPAITAVIADSAGSPSFNETNISMLPVPAKLTATASVTFDKPNYVSGQTCSFHIIARTVKDNSYVIPEQKEFILKTLIQNHITGSSSIVDNEISINEYGTYAGTVKVPEFMHSGAITLNIFEKNNLVKPIGGKSVTIAENPYADNELNEHLRNTAEYSYGDLSVLFVTDRDKYFYGDPVWVKAFITDTAGRSYAGIRVRWMNPLSGEYSEVITAADGGIDMKIPDTSPVPNNRTITFTVTNHPKNSTVFTAKYSVPLIPRTFNIMLDPELPDAGTAVTGEPKTVRFFTKLPDDSPITQKVYWIAKRIDEAGEPAGAAEGNITTSEKDGSGTFTFTPKTEGTYTIALEGKGPYENPVKYSFNIYAIGEKNEQKLWIFTDKNTYTINDEIELKIYSLLEGRQLAFVTLEKRSVEKMEKIYVTKGWNSMKLPLKGINETLIYINASVMSGNKFHHAEKPVGIKRRLEIAFEGVKETCLPGEEIELKLSVKDSSGTPCASDGYIIISDSGNITLPDFTATDAHKYIVTMASNTLSFAGRTEEISEQLMSALQQLQEMSSTSSRVMLPLKTEEQQTAVMFDDNEYYESDNDMGFGGGMGGRSSRIARGGGSRRERAMPPLFNTIYAGNFTADASGTATVKFKMPFYNSSIYLHSFACSKGLLYGSARKEIKIEDTVNFNLIVPAGIYVNDKSTASIMIRNLSTSPATAEFDVKTIIDGAESSEKYRTPLQPMSGTEVYINLAPKKIQDASLTLTYKNITRTHVIKVENDGDWFTNAKSGMTAEETELTLSPPDNAAVKEGTLVLSIATTPENLLRGIAGSISKPEMYNALYDDNVCVTAKAIAKISLLNYLVACKKDEKQLQPVRNEISSLLNDLQLLRTPGAGWIKNPDLSAFVNSTENSCLSALAYIAFASASKLGVKVDEKFLEDISGQLSSSYHTESNDDVKALILYALSVNDKAQFGYINRLYHDREKLSVRSMALLASILKSTGKNEMAAEIAAELTTKAQKDKDAVFFGIPAERAVGFADSNISVSAIAFKALIAANTGSEMTQGIVKFLLSEKSHDVWSSPDDTAFAVMALADYFGTIKTGNGTGKTAVKINGTTLIELSEKDPAGYSLKELPAAGIQKIQITAGGKTPVFFNAYYRCAGGSRTVHDEHISTTATMLYPRYFTDGVEINENYRAKKQEPQALTAISAGTPWEMKIEVELSAGDTGRYLLEQEFPSGILLTSEPDASKFRSILIKTEEGRQKFVFTLPLYPLTSGTLTVKPARIFRITTHQEIVHTGAKISINVLRAGEDFRRDYKLNYGQHYLIGRYCFDKKDYKKALEHLKTLLTDETLNEQPYQADAALTLLQASIREGLGDTIITSFEILKEKAPDTVLTFEDMKAVAKAYEESGEFERAINVYSAICEAYFLQESNIAGALERIGSQKRSVIVMNRIILDYHDCKLVQDMQSGLAQKLSEYGKQAGAVSAQNNTEKRFTRTSALEESARMFELYLSIYPGVKNCDEISYSLASTYAEIPDYENSEKVARLSAKRYPDSQYLDGFDYICALSLYGQKNFDNALKACEKILYFNYTEKMVKDRTALTDTVNLLMAQVYHAKGLIDKALEKYKTVKTKFPDAMMTVNFLEGQAFSVPEITSSALKDPTEIEIEYSGVTDVDIKVYKMDLLMLFMKYKGMGSSESVEISGVKPILAKTAKLDKPDSHKKEKQKISLDITGKGAYYVAAKAGDFFSSGILLKTGLTIEAQEDTANSMIRVNVYNTETGKLEDNVNVTFISPDMADYKLAKTDPRGIAEINGLSGLVTIVAEKDSMYALYKSVNMPEKFSPKNVKIYGTSQLTPSQYQEELQDLEKNPDDYIDNINKQQKGVETKRTKY